MPDPTPDLVPTPAPDPTPDPAPTPDPTPAPEPFDQERAMATIRAQRAEEARLRAEVAAAKADRDELAALKAAQLTDQQRAEHEAEQAKAEAATARLLVREARLLTELAKADHGIVDASVAAKLIDGVEYDEQGNPTNLTVPDDEGKTLLDKFLDRHVFLRVTTPDPAPTPAPNVNSGSGSGDGPPPMLTVEEARAAQEAEMDPAYYAALKTVDDAPNQYEAWQQIQAARKAAAGKT